MDVRVFLACLACWPPRRARSPTTWPVHARSLPRWRPPSSASTSTRRAAARSPGRCARTRRTERSTAPPDLATALTARLKPHDGHFNVRWSADAGDAAPRRGPVQDPARDNFGIRRVEVLPGNVGYLELRYFADFDGQAAQAPARDAIDAALRLLGHVDALLVDVRDNGGGSPAMVGYLASAFLAPGADVYNTFHSRQGTESEAPLRPYPAPRTDLPLYVLASGRTGSAAEAFAYTLKHAGRATVVGEATGGAANPGRPFPLGGGFSVFVSTGSPVSPVTGGNWESAGVAPQVQVAAADARDAAWMLALQGLLARGDNTAARWTLEALQAAGAPAARLDGSTLAALAGSYGAVRVERTGDALQLRQGRRPPLPLHALSPALFFVYGEPTRRVRFERQANGAVTALELLGADGAQARHLRD